MLHLISYLILKGVYFVYTPGAVVADCAPNFLRFDGKGRQYVIHEFYRNIFPSYDLMEYDGEKPIISNVTAIELLDVVAALV